MERLIYLDTHVIIWLYSARLELFSQAGLKAMRVNDLLISPVVELEIQYLFETNRISMQPQEIINELSESIGLRKCRNAFDQIISRSLKMTWTRDPFDRIITAQASLRDSKLLSKDKHILENYKHAFWE